MASAGAGRGRGSAPRHETRQGLVDDATADASIRPGVGRETAAYEKVRVFDDKHGVDDGDVEARRCDRAVFAAYEALMRSDEASVGLGDDDATVTAMEHLQETRDELMSCLICLDGIMVAHPIWQCIQCFSQLHLSCIKVSQRQPWPCVVSTY